MSAILEVSHNDFVFIQENRKCLLFDYEIQEHILITYVNSHPLNDKLIEVKQKVKLLNSFYSTRVPVDLMAQRIVSICDIDNRLQAGDLSLIHEIACGNDESSNDYFSFATKYCSMHQPNRYPIFDKYVWTFLKYLADNSYFEDGDGAGRILNLLTPGKKGRSAMYSDYVVAYDEFMKSSGISKYESNYRKVDYVIWGLIIIRERISEDNIPFVKTLFPNVIAGLMSSALWQIITFIFANH